MEDNKDGPGNYEKGFKALAAGPKEDRKNAWDKGK